MYYELEEAKYIKDYIISVRFSDGSTGEINLESELYGEVFEPLKDLEVFKAFSIHPELKVITWPNGADLSPEFLYKSIKKAA